MTAQPSPPGDDSIAVAVRAAQLRSAIVESDGLLDAPAAYRLMGISQQAFGLRVRRCIKRGWPEGNLPRPVGYLRPPDGGPLWSREEFEDWLRRYGATERR